MKAIFRAAKTKSSLKVIPNFNIAWGLFNPKNTFLGELYIELTWIRWGIGVKFYDFKIYNPLKNCQIEYLLFLLAIFLFLCLVLATVIGFFKIIQIFELWP